jgi:hypothetical protein
MHAKRVPEVRKSDAMVTRGTGWRRTVWRARSLTVPLSVALAAVVCLLATTLPGTVAPGPAAHGPATPARLGLAVPAAAAYPLAPASTRSYYENNANPRVLSAQGAQAGRAAAQGLVILDFGRPAFNGVADGTVSFRGHFVYLAWVARGVENYIRSYYRTAPPGTVLDVAIGTNNSCSSLEPCGALVCGCRYEPADYFGWGEALAATVEQVGAWSAALRYGMHYTDLVRVVAADDAEPAFDPGFTNTYNVLAGYATTVGGAQPAMVDDGSAEPFYWSEDQLLEVAYGFRPDIPMPQVYFPHQVTEWAALVRYARRRYHKQLLIFGVMAETGEGPYAPSVAYANMLSVLARTTHQASIPWLSTIGAIGEAGAPAQAGT